MLPQRGGKIAASHSTVFFVVPREAFVRAFADVQDTKFALVRSCFINVLFRTVLGSSVRTSRVIEFGFRCTPQ